MNQIDKCRLVNIVDSSKLTTVVTNNSVDKYPFFFALMREQIKRGRKCLYFSFGKTQDCDRKVKEFLFSLIMGMDYPNHYVMSLDDNTIDSVLNIAKSKESYLLKNIYLYINEDKILDSNDIRIIAEQYQNVDYVYIDSFSSVYLSKYYEEDDYDPLLMEEFTESELEAFDTLTSLCNLPVIIGMNNNHTHLDLIRKLGKAKLLGCNVMLNRDRESLCCNCQNITTLSEYGFKDITISDELVFRINKDEI